MAEFHGSYYGPNVRMRATGLGLDDYLIIERYLENDNSWVEVSRFSQASDYCYTNARRAASDLAARVNMRQA